MGDLTKNISRHEIACKCGCGLNAIDWEVVEIVQDACDAFAATLGVSRVVLHINSATRCRKHNRLVGGGVNSQHLHARAMDIVIDGVEPDALADYLDAKYPNKYGIGRYNTFTHIDSRDGRGARWDKRDKL